jgi:hypothetical protein
MSCGVITHKNLFKVRDHGKIMDRAETSAAQLENCYSEDDHWKLPSRYKFPMSCGVSEGTYIQRQ